MEGKREGITLSKQVPRVEEIFKYGLTKMEMKLEASGPLTCFGPS